jgi:hypothetical protein
MQAGEPPKAVPIPPESRRSLIDPMSRASMLRILSMNPYSNDRAGRRRWVMEVMRDVVESVAPSRQKG